MNRIMNQSVNKILTYLSIAVSFLFITNGELLNTNSLFLYYLPYALCAFTFLFNWITYETITYNSYMKWRLLFNIFLFFTMLYAIDKDVAYISVKRFTLQSFIVLLISTNVSNNTTNIFNCLKILIITSFINMLYALTTVDLSKISEGQRMGVTTMNESWNANSLGLTASIGLIILIYLFLFSKKASKKSSFLYLICLITFVIVIFMSGSRKSLLIVVITLLYYLLFSTKSKTLQNLLIAAILIYVLWLIILNVPLLYDLIGHRFESMIVIFTGEKKDKSFQLRQEMIDFGLKSFINRPFLGYGINCFKVVFSQNTGVYMYAHNNYIELLVDTGIVGLFIYYYYIIRIFIKSTCINKEKIFLKGLLLGFIICDVGLVSFIDPLVQVILCLVTFRILNKD